MRSLTIGQPRPRSQLGLAARHARLAGRVLALTAVLGLVSCRSVGEFVWVDAYVDAHKDTRPGATRLAYVIAPGDSISVHIENQESVSRRARVRQDGMISLPFVNDIQAAGLKPEVLAERIRLRLKGIMVKPVITVSLEEPAPLEVSVVGEVVRPGVYRVDQDPSVLKALASAGGLTQFASRNKVFVLRPGRATGDAAGIVRIRFTYEALAHARGPAAEFRLQVGDVVVVE